VLRLVLNARARADTVERNEIRDARNRCGPDTQYGSLAHEIQTRARTMMLAASHMASAMTSISIIVASPESGNEGVNVPDVNGCETARLWRRSPRID
jgi:hypothetical protein